MTEIKGIYATKKIFLERKDPITQEFLGVDRYTQVTVIGKAIEVSDTNSKGEQLKDKNGNIYTGLTTEVEAGYNRFGYTASSEMASKLKTIKVGKDFVRVKGVLKSNSSGRGFHTRIESVDILTAEQVKKLAQASA